MQSLQSSPLLALPRELRDGKYKYASEKGRCHIYIEDGMLCGRTYVHQNQTLLFVRRQTRAETLTLPYLNSIFEFNSSKLMNAFFRTRTPLQKSAIRAIRLRTYGSRQMLKDNVRIQSKAEEFDYLAGLTVLEIVHIMDYRIDQKCCTPEWVDVIREVVLEWSPNFKVSAVELRPVRNRASRTFPVFFSRWSPYCYMTMQSSGPSTAQLIRTIQYFHTRPIVSHPWSEQR